MAFVKKIKCDEGIIGIWEMTESSGILSKDFDFSVDEAAQFGNLKLENRKKEFLAVRLLLRNIIGSKTELFYGKNGNPHLKNNPIKISISHSAELVVVFLSNVQCGIDTENVNRNTLKIASRYLSKDELETTQMNTDPALARIIYWGAKEAVYKCALEREIQFNTQILLEHFKVNDTGRFSAKLLCRKGELRYFNLRYLFLGNNVIVYCVEKLKS